VKRKLALLDWDNTVRPGWTIRDWTYHLEKSNLVPASARSSVDAAIERYSIGEMEYAQMADEVLQALAIGLRGQSASLVAAQAPSFVESDRKCLYPFVRPLFDALSERGISLVIISGAPEEVLSAAAVQYELDGIHGTTFDIQNGHYLGTVKVNRSLAPQKQQTVSELVEGPPALIAIGDSDADLPLLESSQLSLVVDNPGLAGRVPNGLLIRPYEADIAMILRELDKY
jgi:phosphoserine phosphatase